jgi:hypothetical protein
LTLATSDVTGTAGSLTLQPGAGTDVNGSLVFNVNGGSSVYIWPSGGPVNTNQILGVSSISTVDGVTTYTMAWRDGFFICFHVSSTVQLEDGSVVTLDKLRYGSKVLAVDSNMNLIYSEVIDFTGIFPDKMGSFIRVFCETSDDQNAKAPLMLSPNHLIYECNAGRFIQASQLDTSSVVMTANNAGKLECRKVTKLEIGTDKGFYTPLTKEGTVVVNGLVASSHTNGPHTMVRFMYKPYTWFLYLWPNEKGTLPVPKYHWFSIGFRRSYLGHCTEKVLRLFNWS